MTKEIKFKYIWGNGKDFIVKIFNLDQIQNGEPFDVLENEPLLKNYKLLARLQYTGLKDKNGKEIYDGDIYILHTGKNPTNSNTYFKGFVEALESAWRGFSHRTIHSERAKNYRYSPLGEEKNCVVIGNIYENPELLTKN